MRVQNVTLAARTWNLAYGVRERDPQDWGGGRTLRQHQDIRTALQEVSLALMQALWPTPSLYVFYIDIVCLYRSDETLYIFYIDCGVPPDTYTFRADAILWGIGVGIWWSRLGMHGRENRCSVSMCTNGCSQVRTPWSVWRTVSSLLDSDALNIEWCCQSQNDITSNSTNHMSSIYNKHNIQLVTMLKCGNYDNYLQNYVCRNMADDNYVRQMWPVIQRNAIVYPWKYRSHVP